MKFSDVRIKYLEKRKTYTTFLKIAVVKYFCIMQLQHLYTGAVLDGWTRHGEEDMDILSLRKTGPGPGYFLRDEVVLFWSQSV